jgi:hypothetical protein
MDDAEKIAAAWHDELQRLAPGYAQYAHDHERVTWAQVTPGRRTLLKAAVINLLSAGAICTSPATEDEKNVAIVIGRKGLGPKVVPMVHEAHNIMVWDLRIEAAGPAVDKMDIAPGAPVGYKEHRTPFYEALVQAVVDAVVKTLEERGA